MPAACIGSVATEICEVALSYSFKEMPLLMRELAFSCSQSSLFQRTAIGMTFDYKAKVTMKGSTITETYECAFWEMPGDDDCRDTRVELIGNAVHGCLWADHERPVALTLKNNNFNHTFPDAFHEIYRADPPMACEFVALGCGWAQREPEEVGMARYFPF